MSHNLLDSSTLLHQLPKILPAGAKTLTSQQDALAALLHTVLTVLGFRLIGIDESGPSREYENNVLPEEWNRRGPGHYAFKYRHEQSSLEYLVTVGKLGPKTLINSIAIETDKVAQLDISTNDYTSPSFFPHDLSTSDSPLVHGFISSNRIDDLISQLKLTTIQKLVPGLHKEGYTEHVEPTNEGPSRPRAPDAQAPPPARPRTEEPPFPPREDVPYLPRNPLEIGRRDRDPFPANPFAPPPLFGGIGDGMFVGPDHPIFGPGMRGRGPGGMGPWGGDGFLPPLGAPPGARFDPVGPGFGPGPAFPGIGPSRRGPFGGQDPDNDELPPPGYNDMFM